MKARWIYLFLLAVLFGWLVSRPSGPSFARLPGAGRPAPAWTMKDLDGRTVRSDDYRGKVVVLNFWATWCPPCRREIPELRSFQRTHEAEGVVVIGAATDTESIPHLKSFVERHRINYPVLLAHPEVQQTFAVTSLPSTWVIGRDGQVLARYLGALTEAELNRVVGR